MYWLNCQDLVLAVRPKGVPKHIRPQFMHTQQGALATQPGYCC
jgi:hypothetical protein